MTNTDTATSGTDWTTAGAAPGSDAERLRLIDEIERLTQELAQRGRYQFAVRLADFGLTIPQYFALATIERLEAGATMGEVGEAIQAPASSMTSIVDRLERLGLVERHPHPLDRRAVVTRATLAGAKVVREVEALSRRDLVGALDGMDNADLARFVTLLDKLLGGIERQGEGSEAGRP